MCIRYYVTLSLYVSFCLDFAFTYRLPAKREHIILHAYYSRYCSLFITLMGLALLQHAVSSFFKRT